jgi:uncharacterized protein YbaR (Trm112 family)
MSHDGEPQMLDKDSIGLLRCPHCAVKGGGVLTELADNWLRCADCSRQYPVIDDIPVMLPEEGDKWRDIPVAELPKSE